MRALFIIFGILILAGTITDLLWTTLWLEGGAGPLVDRLSSLIWKLFFRAARRNRRILSMGGPLILILSLSFWILLFWAGWTLIFAGSPQSIRKTDGSLPGWTDYVYYTGYTLFTLGNGDFSPASGLWQILTALASGTGMLFLTLSASYVLSILNAVVGSHSFASSVTGFGETPREILEGAWNGKDFSRMDLTLIPLSTELSRLTYQNQAYPLLHYYHAPRRKQEVQAVIPALEDALCVLEHAVPEEVKPNQLLLRNLRSSISDYLDSMVRDFIAKAEEPMPLPDLSPLRDKGIPVVPDEVFRQRMEQETERRKKLKGLSAAGEPD